MLYVRYLYMLTDISESNPLNYPEGSSQGFYVCGVDLVYKRLEKI